MTGSSQQALLRFTNADGEPEHLVDTINLPESEGPSNAVHALARLRGKLLQAINQEDFRTVQQELPSYQDLLEQVVRHDSLPPERLARLESEHQRFHEQLRATLLTTRIALRLDLERVRAAQQYASADMGTDTIDLKG